jgi:hypothetical protein
VRRSRRGVATTGTTGTLAIGIGLVLAACASFGSRSVVVLGPPTGTSIPIARGAAVTMPATIAPVGAPGTLPPTVVTSVSGSATTAPAVSASTGPPTPPTPIPTPTRPTTPAPPALCSVSFVGDSLGAGTLRNGLADALGRVGCPLVWKTAYGGMPIAVGATLLARAGTAPSNVALVMLGFHNARSEVFRGRFPARIDAVVRAAGSRLVVWPLLASTSDCSAGYKAALVRANDELRAATLRWPNLELVDYPAFLAPHPEYSEHRCPHLLPPGYGAAAAWLAGEVRQVVQRRAGHPVA